MAAHLQTHSTLTDRYQTTVPETVRRALRLSKRDRIRYTIRGDGEVVLSRDPALAPFLDLLARDIAGHPERLRAIDAAFVARLQALTADVETDLDASLSPDDE